MGYISQSVNCPTDKGNFNIVLNEKITEEASIQCPKCKTKITKFIENGIVRESTGKKAEEDIIVMKSAWIIDGLDLPPDEFEKMIKKKTQDIWSKGP